MGTHKTIQKILHPLLGAAMPRMVEFFTGCRKLSDATTECKGKMLVNQEIPSKNIMGGKGRFDIYLPAGYRDSGKEYPVLYLLHGIADNPGCWDKKGQLSATVDSQLRQPMIIVMPYAQMSFYLDGFGYFDGEPGHNFESYFTQELQPYIENNFPVLTDREHTYIAGNSMGGYGALYYACRYPHKYKLCYSMSGATEGLDWTGITEEVPAICRILQGRDKGELPHIYMEVGNMDPICEASNKKTHAKLLGMGIEHSFSIYKGGHSWTLWAQAVKRLIQTLNREVPETPSSPR